MSDLKPCPFCGDTPRQTAQIVECRNLECLMYDEEQYVFEWNKRVCPEWVKRAMERMCKEAWPDDFNRPTLYLNSMSLGSGVLDILREEAEKDGIKLEE